MRYTFLLTKLILLYSIIVLMLKTFDCNDICKELDSSNYGKVIFESDSNEYSYYASYYRIIRSYQIFPDIPRTYEKVPSFKAITPQFSFKFYGTDVSAYVVLPDGYLDIYGETRIGTIGFYVDGSVKSECVFSNRKELFAMRCSSFMKNERSSAQANATILIQNNGKITFYYDNIPHAIDKYKKRSFFSGKIQCGGGERLINAGVPGKWINTGTLVEYEAPGDCPKHKSHKACEDASTLDTMCLWCEEANMCISINDKDTHDFIVNGCRSENSLNVHVSSGPTLIKQEETKETITEANLGKDLKETIEGNESHLTISSATVSSEPTLVKQKETTQEITVTDLGKGFRKTAQTSEPHLNMTAETTEHKQGRMSRNLLFIIIPITASFFALFIGCVMCLWLRRKQKSMP